MLSFSPHLVKPVTITLSRYASGYWFEGEYIKPDPVVVTIEDAIIHPTKTKDTLLLKEADRNQDSITIFSSQEMKGIEEGSNSSDIVEYEGFQWKVMKVYPAKMGILNHHKAIANKVKADLTGGEF